MKPLSCSCATSCSADRFRSSSAARSTDPLPILLEGHRVPLDGYYKAFHQELNITRVKLVPLTAAQIAEHLQKVFPGLKTPENFEKELEQVTQGSPLFLGEILCKLVLEQKITLSGPAVEHRTPGSGEPAQIPGVDHPPEDSKPGS